MTLVSFIAKLSDSGAGVGYGYGSRSWIVHGLNFKIRGYGSRGVDTGAGILQKII